MNITGTLLGTIDFPIYSTQIIGTTGGSAHNQLSQTAWDFDFDFTTTNAPVTSLYGIIDEDLGSTVTVANLKSLLMNREELTVADIRMGQYKMVVTRITIGSKTNQQNVLPFMIEGVVTEW